MVGSINTVTDPSGLAFDQADDLYILDGVANTITVVPGPQLQNDNYLLPFDNSTLTGASALAISAGGQSFVIANIASATSDNLLYLNGNRSALAFGSVKVSQSQTQTATEYNIGNLALTLQSPYTPPTVSMLRSTCWAALLALQTWSWSLPFRAPSMSSSNRRSSGRLRSNSRSRATGTTGGAEPSLLRSLPCEEPAPGKNGFIGQPERR